MALWRIGMRSPALYRFGGAVARIASRALGNGRAIRALPGPLAGWTRQRDFPAFASQSFRQRYAKRVSQRASPR
jgi:L-lactate dehydrogenase complex protein LldF